ncbi:acyltransferase family protein [Streptomyces armeniacus]|uniref:acyltransferase family protein n=1 Tax=Streptomyces armeniacus TaxID=83291 RepID=UPI001FE8347D|nr:acyltransferase [Streptomyces armeniacus]
MADSVRNAAARIDAATPYGRDRAVDALRALAVVGVVLGHWLVTALTLGDEGQLLGDSPLRHLPALVPASWVLQSLALFFLVGGCVAARGYAAARDRGASYGSWLRARLNRLFRPAAGVLVLWTVVAGALFATGAGYETVHTLLVLVLSPLWFLLVFAALTALTPLVARLHPLWPLAVVLHVDLFRFGYGGGPGGLGWVNVLAGWLVPYCLGCAWARGAFARARTAVALLVPGVLGTVVLVLWAGYPAGMVGVPGAEVSNLNPPTLAAVSFGLAQCGAALLLREPLRRAMRRPLLWAGVALLNLSAMTVFLWHQTAMLAVTALGRAADPLTGPLTGLHTVPDGAGWVLARLAWLPVFALVLGLCLAAFGALERPRAAPVVVVAAGDAVPPGTAPAAGAAAGRTDAAARTRAAVGESAPG